MSLVIYILSFVLLLSAFFKYIFTYWDRKGVCNVIPSFPAGNFGEVWKGKKSFGSVVRDLYKETVVTPYLGIYIFFRPAILIRDVELVKRILTKDHDSFSDRGIYCNKKKDPVYANLFNSSGDDWTNLRSKMNPLFSAHQIKNMFPAFLSASDGLIENLQQFADTNETVDMQEKITNFSLNTIASIFFGLDVNVLKEPGHKFAKFHKILHTDTFVMKLRQLGAFLCPE